MRLAALKDLNPFRVGYNNELFSTLSADFPEIFRLVQQTLPLDGEGWISGDTLYLLADLADKEGSGLLELQAPEKQALLLGFTPKGRDNLWNSPIHKGNFKKNPNLEMCPFWGPCLGQKFRHFSLITELSEEIQSFLSGPLKISVTGCPQDCRFSLERVDLAILLDDENEAFEIWIGGRHRPFFPAVTPEKWGIIPWTEPLDVVDLTLQICDLYSNLEGLTCNETFPEATQRLGKNHILGYLEPYLEVKP
jgi:dissimilatory sulfite reductase (desulfoviridin) alpha/beta subunit